MTKAENELKTERTEKWEGFVWGEDGGVEGGQGGELWLVGKMKKKNF